jgi:hypothetical protein
VQEERCEPICQIFGGVVAEGADRSDPDPRTSAGEAKRAALFTGATVPAKEMHAYGTIHVVVAPYQLVHEVRSDLVTIRALATIQA